MNNSQQHLKNALEAGLELANPTHPHSTSVQTCKLLVTMLQMKV